MDLTLDWTRGLTHCGHYAVAITFLSIVRPFSDEKFNIYNEHHLVVPLCHVVEHILPSTVAVIDIATYPLEFWWIST